MSQPILDYKCPACGGPLEYSSEDGKVSCGHCGNRYGAEEIELLQKSDKSEEEFSWAPGRNTPERNNEDMVLYNCPSCGAVVECDLSTVATNCPYCDNNVVIGERVSGSLKPNAMIPFKISPDKLSGAVNDFYKDKKLLPKNFFSNSKLSKIQGVYIPFWLFSGNAEGTVKFNSSEIRCWSDSDYDYTETSRYLEIREGALSFEGVPVDASVRMNDALMDSVEPYDFSEMVPYNGAYMAGYCADRYDSEPDAEIPRARQRMLNSTCDTFESTATHSVTSSSAKLNVYDADAKYVLLPVYLFENEYMGRKFKYAVNGQTGKVVGELPISKSRYWANFAATEGVVFAVIMAICLALF